MTKKFNYNNIFTFATLQFSGHFLDHFIKNSEKVVAFYTLSRLGNEKNFIEVYFRGKKIKKIELFSPKNIVLRYIAIYWQYIWIAFSFFTKKEKFYFFNFSPIFFLGYFFIRLFRKVEIVYWIGDYWPMNNFFINIFRYGTHYFHDRTKYTIYLTDRINKKMNKGKVLHTSYKKTVMWGVKPPVIKIKKITKKIKLCFIGVFMESQGVDLLLETIKNHKEIYVKLIGTGNSVIVKKYKQLIKKNKIENQVYFPNRFFYGDELQKNIRDCHIGISLYKVDLNVVNYYADPAKIKQYAEFGLPIIMTDTTEIAQYIKQFNAGILVEENTQSIAKAIYNMHDNYSKYLKGLSSFNNYFNYNIYYSKAFKFLEYEK